MAERTLGVLKASRTPLRVVPEYKILTLDVGAGAPVEVRMYPKGPACPITVLIAEDEAYAEWNDAYPTDDEKAQLTPRRFLARANRAEYQWRRDLLIAASDGELAEEHANVLISEDGPWRAILEELGWLDPLPASEEAAPNPEAQGGAGTGAGPTASPDSAPATAGTTP